MPIQLSLYQNVENTDDIMFFRNKVMPNFQYKIYMYDDYYVIQDPTGFKNYYKKVDYTTDNKSEVFDELGIKHTSLLTEYEYNANGIRIKKITPKETTIFALEGSKIVRMNKSTLSENVTLDFVYDAKSMLVG